MSEYDNVTRLELNGRTFLLVGTAHVSRESVDEVRRVIAEEMPGRVCVEIDDGRYKSMSESSSWSNLDLSQIFRQGKGFLLIANLVLSSFQRRLGQDLGMKPGEEMKASVDAANELGIPYSLCDRDIQITLKRAWSRSSFWGKNKMLAALLSSALFTEKMSAEEIEQLKGKSELQGMMEELASYLPAAKSVLIDERDQYLASRLFETTEQKVLAVVGAGHVPGMINWLESFAKGEKTTDTSRIVEIPPPGVVSRVLPWLIPAAVAGLFVFGFFQSGWETSLNMFVRWILVNGVLSGIGTLAALGHPLTILVAVVAAPFTSLNPAIGVGVVAGLVEVFLRKPRVNDFEQLSQDILSVRGFYRNRLTRALLVFFLSSVGSMIGTFVALPALSATLFR